MKCGNSVPKFWLLVILLLCALLLEDAEARRRGRKMKQGRCKRIPPVGLDEEWFDRNGPKGFDAPLGSKLKFSERHPSANPKDLQQGNKKLKNQRCWAVKLKSIFGDIPLNLHCRYNKIKSETCYLNTRGSIMQQAFKFYGDFVATKTDNETYVVGYGCLFGTKEFWIALTPSEGNGIAEEDAEEILQHIVSLGLSRDEDQLKSDEDAISFQSMKFAECKDEFKGGFPDLTGGALPPVTLPPVKGKGEEEGEGAEDEGDTES